MSMRALTGLDEVAPYRTIQAEEVNGGVKIADLSWALAALHDMMSTFAFNKSENSHTLVF